jgi:chromosome segregation ATPase
VICGHAHSGTVLALNRRCANVDDDGRVVVPALEDWMSKQQLDRMEGRLNETAGEVAGLRLKVDVFETKMDVLQTDVSGLKADVSGLKADVSGLKADVSGLKADVSGLKTEVSGLGERIEDVSRHMGVMHEDLIDRIKALDWREEARSDMHRNVAEVRVELAAHATTDGDAHRFFATSLTEQDRRIGRLESRRKP